MRRAGKIICWISLGLIVLLLLKPAILQLFHLQFYSPWQRRSSDMQRYLQIAAVLLLTLFGTLQDKNFVSRFLIATGTLGLACFMLYFATRNIDRDIDYPTHIVKELYQNTGDSTEKIILQTDQDIPGTGRGVSAILRVKPYSRELHFEEAADTSHLDPGVWKRIR